MLRASDFLKLAANLATAFLIFAVSPLSAHLAIPVGVKSNFLVHGGKVYFAQADSTLTILELQSGKVLKRTAPEDGRFSGSLGLCKDRIVVVSYDSVLLLDPQTLSVIWKADSAYNSHFINNVMVSSDGNGLVSCRDLSNGGIRWQYLLPGAVDIQVWQERVLLFQSYQKPAGFAVLNLSDGRKIHAQTAPAGVDYLNAWDAGDGVIVAAGAVKGEQNDAKFEKLLVFSQDARLAGEMTAPSEQLGKEYFELDSYVPEMAQSDGTSSFIIKTSIPRIQDDTRETEGRQYSGEQPITSSSIWIRLLPTEKPYQKYQNSVILQYTGTGASWTGFPPYLKERGHITQIAESDGYLLVGTDNGYVECIDASTGKSMWLYTFPTIMQTMSYSTPYGMPPYLAERAAAFRRSNSPANQIPGLALFPEEDATTTNALSLWVRKKPGAATRVIRDPAPMNPFNDLLRFLVGAWFFALAPMACMIYYGLVLRRQKVWLPHVGWAALALMLTSIVGISLLGRVAYTPTQIMKVEIILGAAISIYAIMQTAAQKQWRTAVLLIVGTAAMVLFSIPLLRFA